jgi:hypothetical protein
MEVDQTLEMIWVRTRDGRVDYGATPQDFAKDFGRAIENLPAGITRREYVPGVRHALMRGDDTVDGGLQPWPEGDDILANANRLHAAKNKRDQEREEKFVEEATLTAQQRARFDAVIERAGPGALTLAVEKLRTEVQKLQAEVGALQAEIKIIKKARS